MLNLKNFIYLKVSNILNFMVRLTSVKVIFKNILLEGHVYFELFGW